MMTYSHFQNLPFIPFPAHILVRLSNLPNTHCLLQWKDGIVIQRVNVLSQGNPFAPSGDAGAFAKEPDYVIFDIVILEYLERIAKLKLTVVSWGSVCVCVCVCVCVRRAE